MNKLNILEFSHQRDYGGTDKHSELMMKYYDKDKFNVFACSYVGGPRVQWIEDHNIANCISRNDIELADWIRSREIDVAHLYRGGWPEPRDLNLLKMAGVPVIIEQNCFAKFDDSGGSLDIAAHVFCSKVSKVIYRQSAGSAYDDSKCVDIYCPIEIDLYDRCQIDYSKPTFGRFSRKDETKWHVMQVQALPVIRKENPEATFHVIGLPDEFKRIIKVTHTEDMVVEYDAFRNGEEQIPFLNRISIFAHSSRIGESFGNNIAESMAAGLPVVTHSGGDSAQAELVTDGYNGFVVDEGNVQGYARRILYLLRNPDVKERMGRLSKQRAKDWFDPEVTVRKFEDLYIEMYKRKRG